MDMHYYENMKMTSYVAPKLPSDKQYHVYLVHSDTDGEVLWVESLLGRLEKCGFKCVFKDRDFMCGKTDVANMNYFIRKSWKFVFVLSPDYIELVEYAGPDLEYSAIVERFSKDKSKVVCLVLKGYEDVCHTLPTLTIYKRIHVKYDPNWFKKLLVALGAKGPPGRQQRESSFRHCSLCNSDFQQDFRQFQCFMCKKIGCLGCCNYMSTLPPNFIITARVCHGCFEQEAKRRQLGAPVQVEEEPEAVSDPNADRFGFMILLHFGFGGIYKQINRTRSTPKYCDLCKRITTVGMTLRQCRICYEIGCWKCINFCAPLTSHQIAMGAACFKCFEQRCGQQNFPGRPTLAALSIPATTRVKGQFNQEEEVTWLPTVHVARLVVGPQGLVSL